MSIRQLTKDGTVPLQASVLGCTLGLRPGKSQSRWLQDDLYWEGWERSMDDVAANFTEEGRCGATYVGARSNGILEVSMLTRLQAAAQTAIVLPSVGAGSMATCCRCSRHIAHASAHHAGVKGSWLRALWLGSTLLSSCKPAGDQSPARPGRNGPCWLLCLAAAVGVS